MFEYECICFIKTIDSVTDGGCIILKALHKIQLKNHKCPFHCKVILSRMI